MHTQTGIGSGEGSGGGEGVGGVGGSSRGGGAGGGAGGRGMSSEEAREMLRVAHARRAKAEDEVGRIDAGVVGA